MALEIISSPEPFSARGQYTGVAGVPLDPDCAAVRNASANRRNECGPSASHSSLFIAQIQFGAPKKAAKIRASLHKPNCRCQESSSPRAEKASDPSSSAQTAVHDPITGSYRGAVLAIELVVQPIFSTPAQAPTVNGRPVGGTGRLSLASQARHATYGFAAVLVLSDRRRTHASWPGVLPSTTA